jgi:alkylation response protein AidB-like acyl-CoA dehydrogenase
MAKLAGETQEWLDRARALEPLVAEYRDQAEAERRLPRPLFETMRDQGFFSLWTPRSLGGGEVSLETAVRVTEEMARQDGSVGWNVMIAGNTSILWALVDPAAAREIFARQPEAVIAGTILAGRGTAVPMDGGFRLTGRWPFASGCQQADYMVASGVITDGGEPRLGPDGQPQTNAFVLPIGDCRILDTWYTAGLRGTGSHDFEVNDAFVPEGLRFTSVAAPSHEPGPLYNTMITNIWGFNVSAVALGIARDALDSFAELAQTKTSMRSTVAIAKREQVQTRLGEAEALLRAGRAFLYESLRDTWDMLSTGQPVPIEQAGVNRLAYANATNSAVQATDMVFTLAGSSSIYTKSRIERCFRDVHMVTQHGVVGPAGYTIAGKCFLGLGM